MADSLGLRRFVGLGLDEDTPDHSTISRTRRLIDVETHKEVFRWVLNLLADRGLLRGQRIGIDATTLEANAAMRSIVRRETGESYEEFLRGLAKASGLATPTREQLARLDRRRKKRMSNEEWKSPSDGDARIAKMKDGRTHLRGHNNILKRQLIHVGAFNLSLILRKLMGAGTPREWRNRGGLLVFLVSLLFLGWGGRNRLCRNRIPLPCMKLLSETRPGRRRWPCQNKAIAGT